MPIKGVGVIVDRPAAPKVGDEWTSTDTKQKFTCFVAPTWEGDSPPGDWTLIETGSVAVPDDVETALGATFTLVAGEIHKHQVAMRDTPTNAQHIHQGRTDVQPAITETVHAMTKDTSDNYQLKARHRDGASRTLDFKIWKVK